MLGIRSDYTSEAVSDINIQTESVYCKIVVDRNNSLVVGSTYRPPSSGVEYMDRLCEETEMIKNKFSRNVVWIGGDYNLPDINWNSSDITGTAYPAPLNQKFLG